MRISFDIEGDALNEVVKGKVYQKEATKIHCISIYDIDTKKSFLFFGENIPKGIALLRKADLIIGHNIYAYDIPLIERLYGPLNKQPYHQVFDTIIVSRMLYPEITSNPLPGGSHSLKSWGEFLREEKIEYTGSFEKFTYDMGNYCMQDAKVGAAIYSHMQYLPFVKTYENDVILEHKVASVIYKQVENGFSFDLPAARSLEATLLLEKSLIEDKMRKVFPDKVLERWSDKTGKRLKDDILIFNPGSRQQIAERLHEKYQWVSPTTDKGNPQVSEEVLESLPYAEAQVLCEYFNKMKLMSQVSDWIQRAEISRDGKIHGSMNTLGTVTGRMTSKEPNMQQVHSDNRARSLFLASPGTVLVGADLKGLELRMLAHYLFKYDKGIYRDAVTKGDVHNHNKEAMKLDDRNTAKVAIYCFLYGGGDEKFARVIKSSIGVARKTKNNLMSNIPGLKELVTACKNVASKQREVRPFLLRPIPVRKEHAALNTLLQSSGAMVSKVWTVKADELLSITLPPGSYKWIANIHDELQLECAKEYATQAGGLILDAAKDAGEYLGCRCPIEAEYRIGNTWAETH